MSLSMFARYHLRDFLVSLLMYTHSRNALYPNRGHLISCTSRMKGKSKIVIATFSMVSINFCFVVSMGIPLLQLIAIIYIS